MVKTNGRRISHNDKNLHLWEQWDGWIPTRDVMVERTSDEEVFANSTRDLGHRLQLGYTLGGLPFFVEGQDLEKVNVVTGVKGSGKSHLSKVLLMQLIAQGGPCIVFDINRSATDSRVLGFMIQRQRSTVQERPSTRCK